MCSGMGRQCASLLEKVDLYYSTSAKLLLRFTSVTVTAETVNCIWVKDPSGVISMAFSLRTFHEHRGSYSY